MPAPSGAAHPFPPAETIPLLLALPAFAATALLPWQVGWTCAVGVIVVLGVPHGALDVEIGRTLFRPRFSRAWFPIFALPYLALVALVLTAWRVAPELTLAAFLLASVWHFGSEDAGGGGLPALVHGGIPVAVPVLLHPTATAQVFAAVTGMALEAPPPWLTAGSLLWLPLAVLWVIRTVAGGHGRIIVLPVLLCAVLAVLPPLTAFALYFVAVHAPAHTAALIRHPTRAPRVRNAAAAWRLATPATALTVLIGTALWSACPGEPSTRLVSVTLRLLAGLTLPHMLLDAWLDHREAEHGRIRPVVDAAARASSYERLSGHGHDAAARGGEGHGSALQ